MHMIPQGSRLSHNEIAAEIVRDLHPLVEPGQVLELRALNVTQKSYRAPHTVAGCFTDLEALAKAAATLEQDCSGVYVTMNPVDPDLLARACNRTKIVGRGDGSTADHNITRRTLLLVDLDPRRLSGISSTEEEHAAALARAREVRDGLHARGWPTPILADSGNGAHLVYRVDLPNDPESLALVQGTLRGLHLLYSDQAVDVDTSVCNAARIRRLYGTVARKGDDVPDRPHRRSRILDRPEEFKPVHRALLEAIAAQVPEDPGPASTTTRTRGEAIDLQAWLSRYGILLAGPMSMQARDGSPAERFAIRCLNGHEDGAWAAQFLSGAIVAGCHHASCAGLDWRALRAHHEPRPVRAQEAPRSAPEAREAQEVDRRTRTAQETPRRAITRRLSDIAPQAVEWLAPGRIPLGRITAIAGRPGLTKSLLALTIAAAVTRGRPLYPGETSCRSGGVLVLAGEDALADTVVPRLLAAGANMTRIVAVDGIAGPRGERGVSLAEDLAELEAVVDRDLNGDCRLIIIDPPAQFLGRPGQVDSHRDSDVRGVLGPLAALAERRGIAVLLVTHHRKSAGATADQAISGSLAFGAAARAIWHVVPDPEDRSLRLLLPGKCNLAAQAPGLRYAVEDVGGAPRIAWRGQVDAHADDYMTEDQARRPRRVDTAADWLRARLQDGPVAAGLLAEEARGAGYPERTLRRAREEIGATCVKTGMGGGWSWTLPQLEDELAPSGEKTPKSPILQKGPRRGQMAIFEGASENDETPILQKGPNIAVGDLAPSRARRTHLSSHAPPPAPLPDDALAVLGELLL